MEQLFSGFSAADAAAWKARMEKDLKGITFDQLSVNDRNGITIRPFYTQEDVPNIVPAPGLKPGWDICAVIATEDARSGNSAALYELNHGATGIFFDLKSNIDIKVLVKNIELPYIYCCFRIGTAQENTLKQLEQLQEDKKVDFRTMSTFFYHDYINSYLQTGADKNIPAGQQLFLRLFEATGTIGIDADIFLNAGATTTYELACVLGSVNEHLFLLQENNLLDRFEKLHITLSVNTDFFEQISKLRAVRKLLQLLHGQYGCAPEVHIHAVTAQTYRSSFDSYSNLLRDTISGMGAVIGGCNSLYIYPFNENSNPADDFGKRMSRNQQLIFREESYLDKVADAASGSYYIETLTDELAQRAWEEFKETEAGGGLLASFKKGLITQNIRQQAQELVEAYREGKRVLIGVNKFLNPKDEPGCNTPKDKAANSNALQILSLTETILQDPK